MLYYVYKSIGGNPTKLSLEMQDVNTGMHTAQEISFLTVCLLHKNLMEYKCFYLDLSV